MENKKNGEGFLTKGKANWNFVVIFLLMTGLIASWFWFAAYEGIKEEVLPTYTYN